MNLTDRRLSLLERAGAQRPLWPAMPVASGIATPIWTIIAGQLLDYLGRQGIARRADQVQATELAAGTGGTSGQVVSMAPWPAPTNLPAGIGIARQVGESSTYAFVCHDARQDYALPDLVVGELVLADRWIDLDKTAGGVTYRYHCLIPTAGWV